ncbi:hypothetical protein JB92DRAFT_2992304 [Gautieria morchelliformis]|nr:hypothetical protein JB92DRAFT_2992304 [Gautieria morchelliformis]
MVPLTAFAAASVIPCAHLLYGATLFVDDEAFQAAPLRVRVELGQEHGRVATCAASGDSTSSRGTGAIAASAIYEIRESPALPYLKPQRR